MAGSLTGAVASQEVTEARDGGLRLVGNQPSRVRAQAPPDCESDGSSRRQSVLVIRWSRVERAIAQRIKVRRG